MLNESSATLIAHLLEVSVGVVLVNWNGGEYTIPCIESLLAGSYRPKRIVVVDNASIDGSPEAIARSWPTVTLIRNHKNTGFAHANNQGIELLLDERMDYVWILNNDTRVHPDCLATLVEAALRNENAAAFTASILYDPERETPWYSGAVRHPLHRAPIHITDTSLSSRAIGGVVSVAFLSGCCMLVPAWAFLRFGGFIASYIAYSEDSEWCWRVTGRGGLLLFVPQALLWHKVSASLRKNTVLTRARHTYSTQGYYLMARNHIWTVRRHERRLVTRQLVLLVNIAIQLKNAIVWYWQQLPDMAVTALRATAHGLFQIPPGDLPEWRIDEK